jgi:hypothetical protein
MDLPTRRCDEVFHIGTLDAADKGSVFSSSYEGHGLSVSECPEEWERIAELGGLPWWELSRPGGRFADAHMLDEEQRACVEAWGIGQGLVERVLAYKVSWYDSDREDSVYMLFIDETEARDELGEAEDEERQDRKLEKVEVLQGTTLLDSDMGFSTGLDCFDFLLITYVEKETELDGVWWDDILDGDLSAPRGVIFPERVSAWQITKIREPQLTIRATENEPGIDF